MIQIQKNIVKKILIIKLRGIGDVVLSSIIFRNLKEEFPDSIIDFLTDEPSRKILEPLPYLDEILIFPKEGLLKRIKLFHQIRARRYDLVIDLFSNPGIQPQLTLLSGARYRFGFPYKGRKFAYNIFGPPERDRYHVAELHLKCLENLNIKVTHKDLSIGLLEKDKHFADNFFSQNFDSDQFIVGLRPSGGWPSKKCDPVKFAEIGHTISTKFGAKLLVLWGPGDKPDAEEIQKKMKCHSVLAPETDIREMAALISKCNIIIAKPTADQCI